MFNKYRDILYITKKKWKRRDKLHRLSNTTLAIRNEMGSLHGICLTHEKELICTDAT
jgi:hypothetical protein